MGPAARSLAAPIQWSQNGHFYDIIAVPDGITWEQAQFDAMARGGYLATITSAAEQDFIFWNLVNNPMFWDFEFEPPYENLAAGPWIGAFQPPGSPEPAGGWQWVHGEGLLEETYANWGPWSPDQYQGAKQDAVVFFDSNPFDPPNISSDWDDWQPELRAPSYVIEFDEDPLAPSTVHYRGGDTGSVTVRIGGSGFTEGSTARLVRTGEADIVGTPVTVGDEGRIITTTFDLTGKTQGLWDVVVINPDGTSTILPNGFLIEEGRAPQVWVDILGSDVIRPGRPQSFYILYSNRGNVNAVGVPLGIVGLPKEATWTLSFDRSPPTLPEGRISIDWAQVPIHLETDDGQTAIPLLIPVIPPNFLGVIQMELTLPTVREFQIRAGVTRPFFQSPLLTEWLNCLLAIAENCVLRLPPILDCHTAIFQLATSHFDPSQGPLYFMDWIVAYINLTVQCSDEAGLAALLPSLGLSAAAALLEGTFDIPLGLYAAFRDERCEEVYKLALGEQIMKVNVVAEGECTDIAGEWNVSETGTITCIFDGETETVTPSGNRIINIAQNGCDVHWIVPDFNFNVERTGIVEGNTIRASGPFAVPLVGDATFTQNTFLGGGLINENEFTLDGKGIAMGTASGISFSCTATSTAVFTRASEEGVCIDIAGSWGGTYVETYCDGETYSGTWMATVENDCTVTIVNDEGGIIAGTIVDNVLTATAEDPGCGTVIFTGTINGDSISGAYTYSLGGEGAFSGNKQ
jgi:hypothetical protein